MEIQRARFHFTAAAAMGLGKPGRQPDLGKQLDARMAIGASRLLVNGVLGRCLETQTGIGTKPKELLANLRSGLPISVIPFVSAQIVAAV